MAVQPARARVVEVVGSTAIDDIAYNYAFNRLTVRFTNGNVYEYLEVPHSVFGQLMASESIGQAYNALVRGVYECVKISSGSSIPTITFTA